MLNPPPTMAYYGQAIFNAVLFAAFTGGCPFVGISRDNTHPPVIGISYPK